MRDRSAVSGFVAGMAGALVMVAATGAAQQRAKPRGKPAQRPAAVVEAREFRVVDASGEERGSWRAEEDGSSTLTIKGVDGPDVGLMTTADGSASLMVGGRENGAAVMVLRGGRPLLRPSHPRGSITAAAADDRNPSIEVLDATKRVLFQSNR